MRMIRPPVSDYMEMAGWPGTITVRRLRNALDAVMSKVPEDMLPHETREDMRGLAFAHGANIFPLGPGGHPLPGHPLPKARGTGQTASLEHWKELVRAARAADTEHTIGGIIVWKRDDDEERALFKLARHPEWMGLHRILPFMKDMNITLFESQKRPKTTGMALAESEWDAGRASPNEGEMPTEEATELARILRWHGAAQVRWQQNS